MSVFGNFLLANLIIPNLVREFFIFKNLEGPVSSENAKSYMNRRLSF